MKKQQKIIELRTAAKIKVAEIETKIAFAHSEAAGKRARLMWERAAELEGLEVASMERFDVLAKYRAKLAGVNEHLAATVAQLKFEIQQTKSECERQCAVAEDDPEPEEPQEAQEEPVVWLDGRQHTAVITARRILRKLPPIPYDCSIDISLNHYGDEGITLCVKAYNPNQEENKFEDVWLREFDEAEKQAADVSDWLERADRLLAYKPGNDHVAEPIGNLLDNVFGGNPLDDFPTTGEEAENE